MIGDLENGLLKKLKDFPEDKVKVDMSKLVINGHIEGGLTSLMAASKFPDKIKAALAMDPTFLSV